MIQFKKYAFGCLLAFIMVGQVSAANPVGDESVKEFINQDLSCSSKDALSALDSLLASNNRDGHDPWPQMVGVWVNRDRGIYFAVTARDISINEEDYLVEVSMYSLCSRNLLASGGKIYNIDDLAANKTLQLQLFSVSPDMTLPKILLTMVWPAEDEEISIRIEAEKNGQNILIDRFLAVRPKR